MRLAFAADLASRDGTIDKDASSKNACVEVDGDNSACIKRPGLDSLGVAGAGASQLLANQNENLKAIVGNTFANLLVSGGSVSVVSTDALNALVNDLQFDAQMSAQSNGAMVIKNAYEAWIVT